MVDSDGEIGRMVQLDINKMQRLLQWETPCLQVLYLNWQEQWKMYPLWIFIQKSNHISWNLPCLVEHKQDGINLKNQESTTGSPHFPTLGWCRHVWWSPTNQRDSSMPTKNGTTHPALWASDLTAIHSSSKTLLSDLSPNGSNSQILLLDWQVFGVAL